jgi:DNA-binding SARP family transcriptional activator
MPDRRSRGMLSKPDHPSHTPPPWSAPFGGRFRFQARKVGGRRQRGVLAILLLRANQVVPVEQLADELYDGAAPATATGQVRDQVSQLRKLLGPDAESILETRAPGYLLRIEGQELDALEFERMVEQASRELDQGDAKSAAERLRTALALWRGPVLADFAYEPFAQPAIARLEELRLAALERRIDADLRLGRNGTLVGELEELVAAHPLREQLRGQLMLALYRAGRQAEAVGLYHEGRRLLVDELGIEPSSELRELASRVLRQDTSLAADGSAEAGPEREIRNPYKGLHAFIEADAEDFFGREQLVGELVARVADERFLAVVGPSGSGKSSVVLAGLVPEIRARGWKIAVMTAGAYALEELEAALLRIAVNPPSSLREQLEADELGLLRAVKRVLPMTARTCCSWSTSSRRSSRSSRTTSGACTSCRASSWRFVTLGAGSEWSRPCGRTSTTGRCSTAGSAR